MDLFRRTGCQVYIFDCTMESSTVVNMLSRIARSVTAAADGGISACVEPGFGELEAHPNDLTHGDVCRAAAAPAVVNARKQGGKNGGSVGSSTSSGTSSSTSSSTSTGSSSSSSQQDTQEHIGRRGYRCPSGCFRAGVAGPSGGDTAPWCVRGRSDDGRKHTRDEHTHTRVT